MLAKIRGMAAPSLSNPSSTLHCILAEFHKCLERGDTAKIILESRKGKLAIQFSLKEKDFPTGQHESGPKETQLPKRKKKSPSDIRRELRRREAWKQKKVQAKCSGAPEVSLTPEKCARIFPQSPASATSMSGISQGEDEVSYSYNLETARSHGNSGNVLSRDNVGQEESIAAGGIVVESALGREFSPRPSGRNAELLKGKILQFCHKWERLVNAEEKPQNT